MRIFPLVLVTASTALAVACATQQTTTVEIEAPPQMSLAELNLVIGLTKPPEFAAVSISPKGTYIGAMLSREGEKLLSFFDTKTLQSVGVYRFAPGQTVVRYGWASDRRVVIESGEYQGESVAPVSLGEIHAVDVDGSNGRLIFGYRAGETQTGSKIKKAKSTRAWGTVIDPLPADEDHVLVLSMPMTRGGPAVSQTQARVYRVDVRNGRKVKVQGAPGFVDRYLLDERGALRIAIRWRDDGTPELHYQPADGGAWVGFGENVGLSRKAEIVGVSAAADVIYYVDKTEKGHRGVFSMKPDGSDKKLLVSNPVVDPSSFLADPVSGRIIAAEFEADYSGWKFVEAFEEAGRLLVRLAGTFKSANVRVVDQSRDGRFVIVSVSSDESPARYYIADRDSEEVRLLFAVRPWLEKSTLARTEAIRLKATDGLLIHAYLTVPPGVPDTQLPMVVLPHGGPHGVRDRWDFNPLVQMLATQGYAVLQVNFRGSGGYGPAFEEAGYLHWGDRVIDDIIDATRWAVGEGIVDPKRIGIVGSSFGGYAAAMAAVRAPDLFRCVVGWSGLYDLRSTYLTAQNSQQRAFLERVIGPPGEGLLDQSPVGQVEALSAPTLLIHGTSDDVTPIDQAEAFRDALLAANKKVEWVAVEGEGHGFHLVSNDVEGHLTILKFLAKHVRGKSDPPKKTTR